jgi:hypothetical protein
LNLENKEEPLTVDEDQEYQVSTEVQEITGDV